MNAITPAARPALSQVIEGEVIGPSERVSVIFRASPLKQEVTRHVFVPGLSISEMIDICVERSGCRFSKDRLHVNINGHSILRENYARIRVKPGATVGIVAVPGKGALRSVISAVVGILAILVAPMIAGPILTAAGIATGSATALAVTGLIGAGISLSSSASFNSIRPERSLPGSNSALNSRAARSKGSAREMVTHESVSNENDLSISIGFTAAERLALSVIFDEIHRRDVCSLSHMDVAKRAGVGRFMVRQAIGKAKAAGMVTVARRQSEGDTNLIRRP